MSQTPQTFPRTFSCHELFHVFVVAAGVFHFQAVALYAVAAATV